MAVFSLPWPSAWQISPGLGCGAARSAWPSPKPTRVCKLLGVGSFCAWPWLTGVEAVQPVQRPPHPQCRPGAQEPTEHREAPGLMAAWLCRPQASVRPRDGEDKGLAPQPGEAVDPWARRALASCGLVPFSRGGQEGARASWRRVCFRQGVTSVHRFEVDRWSSDLRAVSELVESGSSQIHEMNARKSGQKACL